MLSLGLGLHGCVRVQALLGAAVAAPDEPTDRLALLSASEVDTLLRGFNAAVLAPTELLHPEQTLHGVLEHWAAIQPDAPALVYEARAGPFICKSSCIHGRIAPAKHARSCSSTSTSTSLPCRVAAAKAPSCRG